MTEIAEILESVSHRPTEGLSKKELRRLVADLEIDLATERFLVRKYKRQMAALLFGEAR